MYIKWEGKIEKRRLELLDRGLNYNDIADILSDEFKTTVTYYSVVERCRKTSTQLNRFKDKKQVVIKTHPEFKSLKDVEIDNISDLDMLNDKKLFPEEYDDIEEDIYTSPRKIKELKDLHEIFTMLAPHKVLSLSDLHSPFIDFISIEKAIKDNSDADILLLNGDIFDGQSLSLFDKYKEINFMKELDKVFKFLDVVSKMFKTIVWVGGNHDLGRFEKFVTKTINEGMRDYIMAVANPMDYVSKRYSNLIVVQHDWVQIGDCIFSHPHNYSAVEMKTVVNTNDHFNSIRNFLPNPNYRAIVMGHTHQLGKFFKNDIMLAEQGCLCHMQDYRFKKPSKLKWQTGYAVVTFDKNMKIDFSNSDVIYIK
jgi:predicted phosphodiesterase